MEHPEIVATETPEPKLTPGKTTNVRYWAVIDVVPLKDPPSPASRSETNSQNLKDLYLEVGWTVNKKELQWSQ